MARFRLIDRLGLRWLDSLQLSGSNLFVGVSGVGGKREPLAGRQSVVCWQ